jgi:hypothetical protein
MLLSGPQYSTLYFLMGGLTYTVLSTVLLVQLDLSNGRLTLSSLMYSLSPTNATDISRYNGVPGECHPLK